MKLNEMYVQCFPAAPEERIQHFCGVIQQRIDPLISLDNMNDATLSKVEPLISLDNMNDATLSKVEAYRVFKEDIASQLHTCFK